MATSHLHTSKPDSFGTVPMANDPHHQQGAFSHNILQFVLSPDWRVCSFNPDAAEQFSKLVEDPTGQSLRELLIRLNPDWNALLPESLRNAASESVFLPWHSQLTSGMGWQLQTLASAGNVFLSLVPGLSPELSTEVPEDGLGSDPRALQKALRNLFLRNQQQELKFRHFMRHLPGAHFAQSKDLSFSLFNDSLVGLLGKRAITQLQQGVHWWAWVHPADLPDFNRNLETCRNGRVPVSFRFRLRLPDEDRVLYLMDLRLPVRGIDGEIAGYEGIWLDLTREAVAEKRLQQASWKESLAEVSGSLSHDFNNVLTGICSLAGLVFDSAAPDCGYYDYLRIIRDTSKQAQGLIQRIVSLNREQGGAIELHNLNHIIRDQEELIRILLPRDARFTLDLPETELAVRLDAVALRRILINFATNARDALGRKGSVRLKVEVMDLALCDRNHLLSNRCPQSGNAARISFMDDGCGIDPAILDRIFGPYFSTKAAAQGSGLGLYSVTQFARENGFDFGVKSQLGEGTEMILLIPLEDLTFEEDVADEGWMLRDDLNTLCMGSVGVIGQPDKFVRSMLGCLAGNGLDVEYLPSSELCYDWVRATSPGCRILIYCLDHSSEFDRRLCELLAERGCSLLSVLTLRGINPDRFSDLLGNSFDLMLHDESCPQRCGRRIIDLANAHNDGEGQQ